MATVLNIKDPEAYALAEELAQIAGESLTSVVKQALREKLQRERDQRGGLAKRLLEIAAMGRDAPTFDDRPTDEILGYDDNGAFG